LSGRLLLVYDGPRAPWDNMAIDMALLELVDELGPVMRLYEWSLPTISLGRRQVLGESVDLDVASRLGLVLVRRPTGGRALYHSPRGEITYSITLPSSHPLYSMGVVESAAGIAGAVALALKRLGVPARVGGFQGHPSAGANCILSPGASDVVVGGRKLSGSAQYRSGKGLLQHGSILVSRDLEGWKAIRGPSVEEVARLSTTIEEHLGRRVSRAELAEALGEAIEFIAGLEVVQGGLEPRVFEVASRFRDKVLLR